MEMPRTGTRITPKRLIQACYLLIFLCLSYPALALEYSWENHEFSLGGRARLAEVQTPSSKDAKAASILFRAHLESQWSGRFRSVVELDHVELFWEDQFSNGMNFNGTPIIPDVAGTDLNQAVLFFEPSNLWTVSLGREAYNLGNQRFVGTNSFWQNEQSFDGAGATFEFGSASHFRYQFIRNTNRINGDDAGESLSPSDSNFAVQNGQRPAKFLGDHKHRTHLVFAEFREWDFSTLQAYAFEMNIRSARKLSNRTAGLRYEYKGRVGKFRTQGHLETALQKRQELNTSDWLSYQSLGLGIGVGAHQLSLLYERLGEKKNVAFVTPLASLHDKNGWADMFLLTPNSGLRDVSLRYVWRDSPVKIDTRYHFFHADDDQRLLGTELDLDLELKLNKVHSVLFRAADFRSKDPLYSDEQRYFLMYRYQL